MQNLATVRFNSDLVLMGDKGALRLFVEHLGYVPCARSELEELTGPPSLVFVAGDRVPKYFKRQVVLRSVI